jgi:hypothetical protein
VNPAGLPSLCGDAVTPRRPGEGGAVSPVLVLLLVVIGIPANRACVVEVAAIGSTPRTWTQKLRGVFRSGQRRSLPLKALGPVRVELHQKDGSDPINAKLAAPKHTSFTIAAEGATIVVTCQGSAKCEIDLSKPAEET